MIPDPLLAQLPAGERVLWQGRPCWKTLARRGFHLRFLAIYFAVLLAWYAVSTALSPAAGSSALGASMVDGDGVRAVLRMAALALTPLGLVLLYAWMTAAASFYVITDKRLVMRIGIAFTITLNLPFTRIASAGLKLWSDGHGDIPVGLLPTERVAFLVLWPHARPWRVGRPEPMLRCVPEAARVAQILARALGQTAEVPVQAPPRVVRLPVAA